MFAYSKSIICTILASNILYGDVHPNPGPFIDGLKFCHWNLNSICARDKIKTPLIEAYNSVFHYDLIALSKKNLNETIHNEEILVEGFSKEIFRNDHPSGDKQGGVCIYFKENFPIKHRKDLEIMQESIVCEISLRRKKILFVAVYHSPNQTNDEFEVCYNKLQDTLDQIKDAKPHCIILIGNFICRSTEFWPGDIDSLKEIALDELNESNNMTQLIDQPTNLEH